jgi:hypothetical protein
METGRRRHSCDEKNSLEEAKILAHFSSLLIYHFKLTVILSLHMLNHRLREIGQTWLWGELEKNACFEKLENFSGVFQNGLAFLGRIGKASLSEFPETYG